MNKYNFLYYSKDIKKGSYIWNMTGSMLYAFQSVIFLVILTRIVDLSESGLFVIAFANANLFLNIGKYGMRNFQVSDLNDQFSFKEYMVSRYITTVVMILAVVIFVVVAGRNNGYSLEKSNVIICMCIFKAVDSVEDVFLGLYQQKGRLDISGKCLTLRMVITIIVFASALAIYKKLLPAIIISTVLTAIVLIVNIVLTYYIFVSEKNIINKFDFNNLLTLLKKCFPLFLGLFLAFYIGNAPKYAIDAVLDDDLQAIYGFISMPVFLIGLLNNFIFNPIIVKISEKWKDNSINDFKTLFRRQIIIIGGIIAFCEAGAYLLGIPVLSLLYNTDLSDYKNELLILLLGGGFLAYSGFLVTVLTIMRKQRVIAGGYVTVALTALFMSYVMVNKYGVMGASVLYLLLMFILCIMFIVPVLLFIKKRETGTYNY